MHSLNLSLSLLLSLLHRDSCTLHFALNTCALDCKRQVQKSATALPAIITNNRVHNKNAVAEKKTYITHTHTHLELSTNSSFSISSVQQREYGQARKYWWKAGHTICSITHTQTNNVTCVRAARSGHTATHIIIITRELYFTHSTIVGCWFIASTSRRPRLSCVRVCSSGECQSAYT